MKLLSLVAVSVLSFALPLSAVGGEAFRAGWARLDITPTESVTLAGYASRKELSQGVHDPLSARVIAFEGDGARLVLVSADNLGFYGGTADTLRAAILEQCQLKPSELFLCAVHTHSAPALTLDTAKGHANNVAYTKALQQKLVTVTRTALGRLAPVHFGVGSGSSPIGVNRREVVQKADGTSAIVLGRNPSGPCDPEVQVLKLVAPGRDYSAALIFAYATHSTSLGPKNLIISGDIHGLAEQFLEQQSGSDCVAAGFAGASGDIDPWYRVLPGFNTNNGWVPETVLMAKMLGEEVASVAQRTTTGATNGSIRSLFRTLQLPRKTSLEGTNTVEQINVTVGCVGEVAFVGLGGEIFSQLGKALKTGSPFRYTFVFTHCNGTAGYVPTAESYSAGGYEVQSSRFSAGADAQLVRETLQLLGNLKAPQ